MKNMQKICALSLIFFFNADGARKAPHKGTQKMLGANRIYLHQPSPPAKTSSNAASRKRKRVDETPEIMPPVEIIPAPKIMPPAKIMLAAGPALEIMFQRIPVCRQSLMSLNKLRHALFFNEPVSNNSFLRHLDECCFINTLFPLSNSE